MNQLVRIEAEIQFMYEHSRNFFHSYHLWSLVKPIGCDEGNHEPTSLTSKDAAYRSDHSMKEIRLKITLIKLDIYSSPPGIRSTNFPAVALERKCS